tara:strand:+ start:102 stop:344 length:243 start_codon:yes stop_codon:yes gene_type:complete
MKCIERCREEKRECIQKECRCWINSSKDLNCVFEAVKQNGPMTLSEVGKRLGLSFARVKQIETSAIKKIGKLGIDDDENI